MLLPAIPPTMIQKIITDAHESGDIGQHSGIQRTFGRIANKFYFPQMFQKVKNYIQSCDPCQKFKIHNCTHGHIQERKFQETRIFQRLNIDVLGPIRIKGWKRQIYIVVIIDQFSKFIFLKAYFSINSAAIIDALDDLFINFPCPERLHSDNASYFTSNKIKEYIEEKNINQTFSIAYSPITNGLVEHTNILVMACLNIALESAPVSYTHLTLPTIYSV